VRWLGFAAALGLLALAYRPTTPNSALLATLALLLLLALSLRRAGQPRVLESAAVTVFGGDVRGLALGALRAAA
jgi:hypothetical protein